MYSEKDNGTDMALKGILWFMRSCAGFSPAMGECFCAFCTFSWEVLFTVFIFFSFVVGACREGLSSC